MPTTAFSHWRRTKTFSVRSCRGEEHGERALSARTVGWRFEVDIPWCGVRCDRCDGSCVPVSRVCMQHMIYS